MASVTTPVKPIHIFTVILAGMPTAQVSDWGIPVAPIGFFYVFSMLVLCGLLVSGSNPIKASDLE
jgi:hypothetical protein